MENFKVTFSIKRQDTDEPVVHKVDGQRFARCHTVKLNVNTTYTINITIRPELVLRGLHIQGEKLEFTRIKPDKIEDDGSRFQAAWTSTGCTINKSGDRKDIVVLLEFDNLITMTTSIQVKFYEDKESNHAKWGNPLHTIEYDCGVKEGQTFVDIIKEKYF
ncbi:hypothetical protein LOTGIDRAFT_205111 [Lottia gigantea]|uniref:CB1 cannabinoid receptor-interacting protein 1 n=1 Tax=Lottia gigantea TaxID=225164 RepID=V4B4B4_LOTGI|nr:hypothetical protein LOTGIDRAFT_205111 [Lottia gigantea]ESP02321.1 hypothetical protein LOTGIDRAFT_205111 [Lottia gigantea]